MGNKESLIGKALNFKSNFGVHLLTYQNDSQSKREPIIFAHIKANNQIITILSMIIALNRFSIKFE